MNEAIGMSGICNPHTTTPAPSLANFLFFDAREDAGELARRMLPYGVIVKPWREPAFSEHIRVSIGAPRSNDLFLAALGKAAQPR